MPFQQNHVRLMVALRYGVTIVAAGIYVVRHVQETGHAVDPYTIIGVLVLHGEAVYNGIGFLFNERSVITQELIAHVVVTVLCTSDKLAEPGLFHVFLVFLIYDHFNEDIVLGIDVLPIRKVNIKVQEIRIGLRQSVAQEQYTYITITRNGGVQLQEVCDLIRQVVVCTSIKNELIKDDCFDTREGCRLLNLCR